MASKNSELVELTTRDVYFMLGILSTLEPADYSESDSEALAIIYKAKSLFENVEGKGIQSRAMNLTIRLTQP